MTEPRTRGGLLRGCARPWTRSKAKAAADPQAEGGRGRAGRGRPGRPGAGRPAAGPPRPPLRLRSCPRRWPTTAVPGRPGQGPVRRPGRRRLRRRARARRPTTPAACSRCGGWSAPSRCSRPSRRAERARRRAVRRRARPTCSGWPCRRGTPPTEKAAVAAPAPAVDVDRGRGDAAWADHRARPGASSATSPRAASPRAVWTAAPGDRLARACSPHAAAATYAAGRGALLCVPDRRDVARVDAALTDGPGRGAPRRAHRRRRSGRALPRLPRRRPAARDRIVVGTRAAAFAPVHDLGLVVDLGRRRRPPRRAARAVPAHPRGAAAARRAAGHGRPGRRASPARSRRQLPRRSGWAHELAAPREPCASASRSASSGPSTGAATRPVPRGARMPARGPRRDPRRPRDRAGARADPARRLRRRRWPATRCRTPARCARVHRTARAAPVRRRRPRCRWCGTSSAPGPAPHVRRPRPARPGAGRRPHRRGAGPDVPRHHRPHAPAATGCSTDVAPTGRHRGRDAGRRAGRRRTGYAAVVLLDTWLTLRPRRPARRPRRRCAAGSTPRRWSGPVAASSRSATRPTRRSRRWCAGTRPASPSARPTERTQAHLPPAARLATVTGSPARSTTRSPCSTCRAGPRCSARSPRPTTSTGSCSGCRAPTAPALSQALGDAPAGALGPQARRRPRSRSTRSDRCVGEVQCRSRLAA